MEQLKLPENWEWVKVKNITETVKTVDPAKIGRDTFIYIEISSIDSSHGVVNVNQLSRIPVSSAPSRARKPIKKDDVIFATTRHYLKNIALIPEELDNQICSTGFCVLRAQKQLVLPKYIYFAVRTDFFIEQLVPKQRGANYPAVADSDVFDSEIPIPFPNDPARSLETQKRIVLRLETLLGEVKSARDLQESIQEDTGRLLDSVIRSTFDGKENPAWQTNALHEVAYIQTGIAKGKRYGNQKLKELPYLRVANVQSGYLELDEIKTIVIAEDEVERYKLQKGDLLLTEGGDFDKLGRGAVWNGEIDLCVHQNHVFAVRFDQEKVLPKFAEYAIQSKKAKDYFVSMAKKTTNLASINKTQLSAFPLSYPSNLNEQRAIVKRIDSFKREVKEMENAQAENQELIEQLEQSFLSQAFRGEL